MPTWDVTITGASVGTVGAVEENVNTVAVSGRPAQ
jgi:hypothetical protein